MNVFEQFLNSISYKFPKGYPDMNNEQDILLLETLINKVLGENVKLNEMGILTENDNPYDDLIKSSLKVKTIPKCCCILTTNLANFNSSLRISTPSL